MNRSPLHSYFLLFPLCFLFANLLGCTGSHNTLVLRDPSAPNSPAPGEMTRPDRVNKPQGPATGPTPERPTQPLPPSHSVKKIARIICESQAKDGMTFNTLRGDVVSGYMMPSLTLFVNNQSVLRVKSPVPLRSNGEQAFLILRAQEDNFTPWKIYKTKADLLTSRGVLQIISNYPGFTQNAEYAYQNLKLENRLLAANGKRTAYVYPNDAGNYVWESLKGSHLTLPFSADNAFSPSFIGEDDVLRFDQVTESGLTLTQKFYNFKTRKILSLPAALDSQDFQLFGYINSAKTSLFWIEGRPDGFWRLRSMALSSSGESITLGVLPGNARNVILPIVLTESKGELLIAYAEEELAFDKHEQPYLKTSVLHLVKANARLGKLTNSKNIDYAEEIKSAPQAQPVLSQEILRGLFLEPLSGKLYASIVSQGGLASFDLKRNTWETHAMVASIFSCLNPEWGIEISHE
ncbi:MAG: hypothetical protein ACXWRE_06630 [Pseudobdellovibrionaceae bacterium]